MPRIVILNVLYNMVFMPDHVMGTRPQVLRAAAPMIAPQPLAAAQTESSSGTPGPGDSICP